MEQTVNDPAPDAGIRVLVLDDQDSMRRLLHRILTAEGCAVETVRNGQEGLQCLLRQDFDVAILDLRMPEMDGMAFLQEARKIWPWLGIIITSGYLDDRDIDKARRVGVTQFIPKPIENRLLLKAVRDEVAAKRAKTKVLGAQLFDQIQYQLGVLRQISEAAIQAQNLSQALRGLSLGIGRIMTCDVIGMLAVEADERLILLRLKQPQPKAVAARIIGELIARYRVLTARNLSVDMVRVEIEGVVREDPADVEVASLTTVPVITGGEVCGLLMLASLRADAFSVTDITFLYHAANHLSTFLAALTRMRQLAIRDPLTDLYNRRHLDAEGQRLFAMTKRYRTPMSVLILDIDFFKQINDQHGHQAGDQVIRETAALLRTLVRTSDIVGRYGGDEFMLLLPKSDTAGATQLAERILKQVRQTEFCKETRPLRLTLSMGIASFLPDDHVPSHEEILARADQALYEAKAQGRNRLCAWEDLQARLRAPPDAPGAEPAPGAGLSGRLLIVDDDPQMGRLLSRMLNPLGLRTELKSSADEGLTSLRDQPGRYDVVLTDLSLPGQDGFAFLSALDQLDPTLVRIVITGHATLDNAVAALRHGAYDFVGKPFVRDQLLAVLQRALQYRRLVVENQRYQQHLEDMIRAKNAEVIAALDELRRSYEFTLEALVAMLDAREFETRQHSTRVRDLTLLLATSMGFDGEALKDIGRGALLHDIGKIGIPDAILLKPGALNEDEWQVMRQHPTIGHAFLERSPFLQQAADIVLAHHERFDGSGYPRGLQGEAICLGARLFSVIDVYDAMRSPRRYKPAISAEDAVAEIRRLSGVHFDPAIVAGFLECQGKIENAGLWATSSAMAGERLAVGRYGETPGA